MEMDTKNDKNEENKNKNECFRSVKYKSIRNEILKKKFNFKKRSDIYDFWRNEIIKQKRSCISEQELTTKKILERIKSKEEKDEESEMDSTQMKGIIHENSSKLEENKNEQEEKQLMLNPKNEKENNDKLQGSESFDSSDFNNSMSDISDVVDLQKSEKDHYSFQENYHSFRVTSTIEKIKFANQNQDLVGFSCRNGNIHVASIEKKKIICVLQSHTKVVLDFDWSSSNEYIISCSKDKHIKIWIVEKARCIRSISTKHEVLGIRFFPFNNNRFVIAASNYLQVYNFSLGKPIQKIKLKYNFSTFHLGQRNDYLFAGDIYGYLYTFRFDQSLTKMKKLTRIRADKDIFNSITSISYKERIKPKGKRETPFILVNNDTHQTLLFKFNKENGSLIKIATYELGKNLMIKKSVVCPLIYPHSCFTAVSKDSLFMFDLKKKNTRAFRSLNLHTSKITDVCWNYNETFLASSDLKGILIIWKRNEK